MDTTPATEAVGYQVRLATTADDVLAAQRLRDQVFAGAQAARTARPTGAPPRNSTTVVIT